MSAQAELPLQPGSVQGGEEISSACSCLPLEAAGGGERQQLPGRRCLTLEWTTGGFVPEIKWCLNAPAASAIWSHSPQGLLLGWEWSIMSCNRHCARGRKLSSLLTSLAHNGGASSIPCKQTRIPLGRFSSGEDAEAILEGL